MFLWTVTATNEATKTDSLTTTLCYVNDHSIAIGPINLHLTATVAALSPRDWSPKLQSRCLMTFNLFTIHRCPFRAFSPQSRPLTFILLPRRLHERERRGMWELSHQFDDAVTKIFISASDT